MYLMNEMIQKTFKVERLIGLYEEKIIQILLQMIF